MASSSSVDAPTASPFVQATQIPVTLVATQAEQATSTVQPAPTVAPTAAPQVTPSFLQLTEGQCCVQPFFSPDSSRVLYLDRPSPDAPVGIWSVMTDRPLSQPELFTDRLGPFSADFSHAVSLESGQTVVERLSDGARWVINNGGRQVSFSPDARLISWSLQQESGGFDVRRTEVWIANTDGSQARRVAARFGGGALAWFPDSRRMLLGGRINRNDEKATLSILDVNTGSVRDLMSYERLRGATLSPDGKRLAYFIGQSRDGSQDGMYVLDLEQPNVQVQPQRLNFFGAYRWRDGNRLLYVPLQTGAPSNELWQLDATTGEAQQLIAASADSPFKIANGDWDVARDGSRIVFLNARDRNLWLVVLP